MDDKLPKHIKDFFDNHKKVDKLLNTTAVVHSKAYLKGAEAITDASGEIDYELLEDVKNQDKVLDRMIEHYVTEGMKSLGVTKKPKGEIETDMFLQKYVGITKAHLKKLMRTNKSGYTLKAHEGIRDELIKKQSNELMPLRSGHLENEHLESILKYTGTHQWINKDNINIKHGVDLLDMYRGKGEVTLGTLQELVNTPQEKGGWGTKTHLSKKGKQGVEQLEYKYKTGEAAK